MRVLVIEDEHKINRTVNIPWEGPRDLRAQ